MSDARRRNGRRRDGSSGGRTATIRISRPVADVQPALSHLLEPLLQVTTHAYRAGGPCGYERYQHGFSYHKTDSDGRLQFPAGMVPRIREILERHGYTVAIEDLTEPRPRCRPTSKLPANACARALLDALCANPRGLIAVPRSRSSLALIGQIVRSFPRAVIHVVVAGRAEAGRLRRRLARYLGEAVGLITGGYYYTDYRVLVCTFGSFIDHVPDIVVLPHASEATAIRKFPDIATLTNHRLYGFVTADEALSAVARMRREALFGPVIYEAPNPKRRLAPVRVLVADAPLVTHRGDLEGLDRKRAAIWGNERRNAAIAEIAMGFADGRTDLLWKHGLLLDVATDQPDPSTRSRRVAILVESPEHGRALRERLPGWRLRTGPGDRAVTRLDRAIVTLVHAHELRQVDSDVLIRADGGAGPLNLPGFPPRRPGDADRAVLLVDIGDDGDEDATAATRDRLREYARRGWPVAAPGRWTRAP